MATKRERRERLRQEREAAEQAAAAATRRRLFIGYLVAGVIAVAIVAGVVVAVTSGGGDDEDPGADGFPELAFIQDRIGAVPDYMGPDGREGIPPPEPQIGDLEQAAQAAGCDLQLDLEDEGGNHFSDENRVPDYQTNPPTSGDHYANPSEAGAGALADGAYLNTPPVARTVHSMEHGRVLIQYSPDLPERDQLEIKGVFEESPEGVLMFPNPDMPYEVAVTAWTQLAGCETYEGAATLDVLRVFRDTYRGGGPEGGLFPLSV